MPSYSWPLTISSTPTPASATVLTNAPAPPPDDVGADILVFPDLDPTLELRGGAQAFGQYLLKRLTTRKGTLEFWPDWGVDIRDYLNEDVSDDMLTALQSEVENELARDERIDAVAVAIEYRPGEEATLLTIACDTASGPYTFVVTATEAQVTITEASAVT